MSGAGRSSDEDVDDSQQDKKHKEGCFEWRVTEIVGADHKLAQVINSKKYLNWEDKALNHQPINHYSFIFFQVLITAT